MGNLRFFFFVSNEMGRKSNRQLNIAFGSRLNDGKSAYGKLLCNCAVSEQVLSPNDVCGRQVRVSRRCRCFCRRLVRPGTRTS